MKKRVALSLSGILFALLTLEFSSRILLPKPQTFQVANLQKSKLPTTKDGQKAISILEKFGLDNLDFYYQSPTGPRFYSNIKGVSKNHYISKKDIEIKTNSLGYRDEEIGPKKDNGFRILALGDSITAGDYLQHEDTYPALLEKYLNENPPENLSGKNIQVINAGVATIGTGTELAILSETGLSTKPDVIFVQMYLNDAEDSLSIKLVKIPPLLQKSNLANIFVEKINSKKKQEFTKVSGQELANDAQLFIRNNPVDQNSSKDWQNNPKAFNRLISENFNDWGFAWSDNFWQKEETQFSIINQIAKKNNAKLIVVLFPVSYQVQSQFLNDYPQKRFEEVMTKLDITHLDLLPKLREKYALDNINIFYDQAHPTEDGMQEISEKLSEFLRINL